MVTKRSRLKHKDKIEKQLSNESSKVYQRNEDLRKEVTKRKKAQDELKVSENRYRRLFETAQDGIILLDAVTGQILDINPFLIKMLEYSHKDFLRKKIWEIGTFKDIAASRIEFLELQKKGYVRYEHLPLETKSGQPIDVEFVSNVYLAGHKRIIQCNIRDITLRKQAERKRNELFAILSSSKRAWENTFDSITDGILILDKNFNIIKVNKAFAESVGLSPREVINKKCYELLHGIKFPVLNCPNKVTLKNNKPATSEIIDPKTHKTLQTSTYPYYSQEGDLIGSIHITKDITLQKSTNRALQVLTVCNRMLVSAEDDEEEFLRNICETLTIVGDYKMAWVGFAENDAEKTVRLGAFAGFEKEYLMKMQITWADTERGRGPTGTAIRTMKPHVARDILHDPNMASWREDAEKNGYVSSIALPFICDSKTRGSLNIYSDNPGAFDSAEIALLMELADDVAFGIKSIRMHTEKIKAEKELKKREKYLRSIIENSQDIITVLNNDGTIQYESPVIEQILGFKREELLGKSVFEYLHPDEKQKAFDIFTQGIQEPGRTELVEVRFRHKDGSWRYLESKAKNLLDNDELPGVAISSRDITERKIHDDEYKKLQFQLYQSQKMEAIGQLSAGIAHDFSNLLTVINGYGNMLYNALKDNEPIRDNIEQILNASNKAVNLAQKLLTFGRKNESELTSLELNKIITDISPLLKALLGDLVVFQTALTSKQLTIVGNITQVEQIMLNLTGNANDAMPKGGYLTLTTEYETIDEQFIREHGFGRIGNFALISVTDTGTGIERDIIGSIFEPFFTTKPAGKGTGLGLSIVHDIVKGYNGFMDVLSYPGKMTTFRIYLPVIEQGAHE